MALARWYMIGGFTGGGMQARAEAAAEVALM